MWKRYWRDDYVIGAEIKIMYKLILHKKIEIKGKKNKIRVEGDNHKGDSIISWEKSE